MCHISRRSSYQQTHRVLLHIFRHIESYQRLFAAEHLFCQALRKIGFADARLPQEEERTDWSLRVAQSQAAALDGLNYRVNGFVLTDDLMTQGLP